jgi:hypothetical protein
MAPIQPILAVFALISALPPFMADALAGPTSRREPVRLAQAVAQTWDIPRDASGTPIIMKGYAAPRRGVANDDGETRPERRVRGAKETEREPPRRPRGSSTYIPPPVPSPNVGRQDVYRPPAVEPYNPPPIRSYGDRVINCIHSFPLNRGIGNNPTDQQSYIRQCAN